MNPKEYAHIKYSQSLSRVHTSLCFILAAIMIVMIVSYYITTLLQLELSKLTTETSRLNTENVELQNSLDKLMSYNNVEELVRNSGILDATRQSMEMDTKKRIIISKKPTKKNNNEKNYYRWSLGF